MKQTLYVQFRFPANDVLRNLPRVLRSSVSALLEPGTHYCSLRVPSDTAVAQELRNDRTLVKGRSLIRLLREVTELQQEDIDEAECYVLKPAVSSETEVRLSGRPARYYVQETACGHCGRFIWRQLSDLCIATDPASEFDETETGELLISRRLRTALLEAELSGFSVRSLHGCGTTCQLVVDGMAVLEHPSPFVLERDSCRVCGKPRARSLDDSNGVDLFRPPFDTPRVERTPSVVLRSTSADCMWTDLEFGTLGQLPEGATPLDSSEFTHRTSKPILVVTGRLVQLLYAQGINDFRVAPAVTAQTSHPRSGP